jgi:hypothetical protein
VLRTNQEPEYRRRVREKAEQDQKRAENERDRAAKRADIHEIVIAIEAIDEKYNRETHKEHTRKKRDRFWEVLGVAGLWIAAAVGVAAISYGTRDADRQRGIMSGQLGEMQSAQRPWIQMENIVATGPLYFENGQGHIMEFVIKNVGRSPARNAFIYEDIIIQDKILDPLVEQQRFCAPRRSQQRHLTMLDTSCFQTNGTATILRYHFL